MNIKKHIALIIAIVILGGCGTAYKVRERDLRVRYVNMDMVFEYIIKSDPESLALRNRKNSLIGKIEDLRKNLISNTDKSQNDMLNKKLKQYSIEITEVEKSEKRIKSSMLNKIDMALSSLAGKHEIDYIFNLGDSLIFSKKEYDITEDLIREIVKLEKRNAPVSR